MKQKASKTEKTMKQKESKKDKKQHEVDDGHKGGENPVQAIQETIGKKNVANSQKKAKQSKR